MLTILVDDVQFQPERIVGRIFLKRFLEAAHLEEIPTALVIESEKRRRALSAAYKAIDRHNMAGAKKSGIPALREAFKLFDHSHQAIHKITQGFGVSLNNPEIGLLACAVNAMKKRRIFRFRHVIVSGAAPAACTMSAQNDGAKE